MQRIISLAWWNSGLCPASNKEQNRDNQEISSAIIKMLTKELHIEIIGLCEVDSTIIDAICSGIIDDSYELLPAVARIGRSKFDTCIIYKKDCINIRLIKNVVLAKGKRNYKIAQIFAISVSEISENIYLCVSHWPSRLHVHEEDSLRLLFGVKLRDEVNELQKAENGKYIILMGDYNDEPFNNAITKGLMASRDRQYSKKKEYLFYNPFWRYLAFSDEDSCDSERLLCDGSYYYRNGEITKWHTFDQIMFSSSFLGNNSLYKLKDNYTSIIVSESIISLMELPKSNLDHLPIMCAIEMEV